LTVSAGHQGVLSLGTYGLSDIVYDDGTVCIPIIHGCEGLVSLLARGIPYLKLDHRVVVESNGLCEEGGSNSRFSIVIELVLAKCFFLAVCSPSARPMSPCGLTLTKRNTSEL
jgi:hypothetical protein